MKNKNYFLLLFYCVLSHTLVFGRSSAPPPQGPYQVCSITLNSSDEIEVFKEQLGTEHFKYTELVPERAESFSQTSFAEDSTNWLSEACYKPVRCDIMVISGHFAGIFFGKKHQHILSVETLEKHSCAGNCKNLLFDVKEVFLFGCNTLAGKKTDSRTPEQYLSVLLEHQMNRNMAERVVATRYLPFGLSFKRKMQMVFSGKTHIYGFDSLSPFGHEIRKPLTQYFQKIKNKYGSYKNYLDQKTPRSSNPHFLKNITGTVKETKGLSLSDRFFSKFNKLCSLYSSDTPTSEGLSHIQTLMREGNGHTAFYAIRHFVQNRKSSFTPKETKQFQHIQNSFKEGFYPLYKKISLSLPYIKIQFLNFLNLFGWLPSQNFYKTEIKKHIRRILKQPNPEIHDLSLALSKSEKLFYSDLYLQPDDFQPHFYSDIWSPLILQNLRVTHYLTHRRLLNLCLRHIQENPPLICYQVLKSLGHLKVTDSLVVDRMVEFLNAPHPGFIYYALYGLAYARVKSHKIHREMAAHIYNTDRWIQLQAIRSLSFLKSKDTKINKAFVELLRHNQNTEVIYELLQALKNMDPNRKALLSVLRDRHLVFHPQARMREAASFFFNH